MSRSGQDVAVVTKEMIGLFIVFGGDLILLVVLLAIVGVASWTVAIGISAVVLLVFGSWAAHRWWRLRGDAGPEREADDEPTDPLGTLKARYAAGELSDEAFEAKLDQLLESDRTVEEQMSGYDSPSSRTDGPSSSDDGLSRRTDGPSSSDDEAIEERS